jgi:hypothetical protein
VEDIHVAELRREPLGDLARPVRGAVVDDEDARVQPALSEDPAEPAQHRLDVLALVVGGEADDGLHGRIIAAWPGRLSL